MHLLCSSLNLPKTCQGYGTASTSSLGISLIRSKRPHAVGPFPKKRDEEIRDFWSAEPDLSERLEFNWIHLEGKHWDQHEIVAIRPAASDKFLAPS